MSEPLVFMRLTVKIFPQDPINPRLGAVRSSVTAKKPGVFLLPIENPDQVTLRTLAGLIRDKWAYLHPDLESLSIKQIFDDAKDDVDLYPELTVADVWVNHGKARADGLDQSGTVRIIQMPAAAAPERFPSVVPDWDAPAIPARRNLRTILKGPPIESRVSPVQEERQEDEEEEEEEEDGRNEVKNYEDEPARNDFWTHLHSRSQQHESLKTKSPAATDSTYQRNLPLDSVESDQQQPSQQRQGLKSKSPAADDSTHYHNLPLDSVESDQQQPSQPGTQSRHIQTPAPRTTSEEIRETPPSELPRWISQSQPQPERVGAAKVPLSKRRVATPGIHDAPSELPPWNIPLSQPQPGPSGSRKRKQSLGPAISIKESRVDQDHPSARQQSSIQTPEPGPEPDSDVEITLISPVPTSNSPAATALQQAHARAKTPEHVPEPDSDVEITLVSPKPTSKSPAAATQYTPPRNTRIERPPSFCSPSRRANWQKELERNSPGQKIGRGLGLGIKRLTPGSQPSQDAPQASAAATPSQDPPATQNDESALSMEEETAMRAQEKQEKVQIDALLERKDLPVDIVRIAQDMRRYLLRIPRKATTQRKAPRATLADLREQLRKLQQAETSISIPAKSTPAESLPVQQTQQTPATRAPVAETPVESTPAKATPVKPTPVKPTPTKHNSVEQAPARQTPAKPTPTRRASIIPSSVDQILADLISANPSPAKTTPTKPASTKHTPVEHTPAKPTPAKRTPAKSTPAKRASAKPTASQHSPVAQTSAKTTTAKRASVRLSSAEQTPAENPRANPTPAKRASTRLSSAEETPAGKSTATPARRASARLSSVEQTPAEQTFAKPTLANRGSTRFSSVEQTPSERSSAKPSPNKAANAHRTYIKDLFASQEKDLATRASRRASSPAEPQLPPPSAQFTVDSSSDSDDSDSD